MAYLGKDVVGIMSYSRAKDTMTGDGSTTTLTLSRDPGTQNNVEIYMDGVLQTPGVEYTLSGNVVTFTTAPETGLNVVLQNNWKILSLKTTGLFTVSGGNVPQTTTPGAFLNFAGTNVYSKMKEGQSLADAVVDPLTGLELSFPGLFKENVSKIISERAASAPGLKGAAAKLGRGALGFGRFGRLMTPIGLGLAGLGQAQEFYNQYQDLQKMKRDDPEAYQQFRSQRVGPALTEEDYKDIYSDVQGAAGGGIMKEGGIESGPQRVSMNPDSEGLASLLKRGSKS